MRYTTKFESSTISGSSAKGAFAAGAIFHDTSILNSNFDDSSLIDTKFKGCRIEKTSFRGANVNGADFSKAKFINVDFDGAKANKDTKWPTGFDPGKNGVVYPEPASTVGASI